MDNNIDWKKYLIVLFITMGLFFTAIYLSNYFGNKKIDELKKIQDKIAVDILSSETQFSLLEEQSCQDTNNSVLSEELLSLGDKLDYSERNSIGSVDEIISLKKYYSLLEMKDYLLMKKISDRCKLKPIFVLYFYSGNVECSDCVKQGYVLTSLREKYPEFRVYSFQYDLDLSAIKTLISVYKISDKMPVLVINGIAHSGFMDVSDIENILPGIKKQKNSDVVTNSIILSPHFDDAALSLGGFISKTPNTKIIDVFTKSPENEVITDWDKLSNFSNSTEAISVRTKEDASAIKILGAKSTFLNYLDFQYRPIEFDSSQLVDSLEKKIESFIQNYKNQQINIYGPALFANNIEHPDHEIVHKAFINVAMKYSGNKKIKFFIYEDFPYVKKSKDNLSSFLKKTYPEFNFSEKVLSLSDFNMKIKKEAISVYASQLLSLNKSENVDILEENIDFTKNRCNLFQINTSGCEAVYQISLK